MRSPTTIGDEAPRGIGVIHAMPVLSGLPSAQSRDHFRGGVAPGKRPVPSPPRQPTGCSGLGRKVAAPIRGLGFLIVALLAFSAAVQQATAPMANASRALTGTPCIDVWMS